MPPVYIVEQGAKLRVEKRRLLVTKDDDLIIRIPFAHTTAVIIFGNISITTPAMTRLMRAGIDTIFLSQNGRYHGRLVGELSKFGQLRQKQYAHLRDEVYSLPLAQQIIGAKCRNMQHSYSGINDDIN